jgi:hypothetical protein
MGRGGDPIAARLVPREVVPVEEQHPGAGAAGGQRCERPGRPGTGDRYVVHVPTVSGL